MAFETSSIFAPVFSHNSEREFTDEILCARNAFADNFDNSEDHKLVVSILDFGTQEL